MDNQNKKNETKQDNNFDQIRIKLAEFENVIKKNEIVISIGLVFFALLFGLYNEKMSLLEIVHSVWSYFVGGSILAQYVVRDSLYNVMNRLNKYLKYDLEYHNIVKSFNELKLKDTRIFNVFNRIAIDYEHYEHNSSKIYAKGAKSLMKFVIELYSPSPIRKTNDIKEIVQKLELLKKDYGNVSEILNNSIIDPILLDMLGIKGPAISPIFLSGNPGVGKTRFVNLLGQIVGAKVYNYNLCKKNDYSYSRSAHEQIKDFGIFVEIMYEYDGSPIILFIDEFDKNLNKDDGYEILAVLLELLGDSIKRVTTSNFLRLPLTMPNNMIVVCASNKTLQNISKNNDRYEPLFSRFIEIKLPDLTKEIQTQSTIEYVKSIYHEFNEEDETFLTELVSRTDFKGLRELINISNTYVSNLKSIPFLKEIKPMYDYSDFRKHYMEQVMERHNLSNG